MIPALIGALLSAATSNNKPADKSQAQDYGSAAKAEPPKENTESSSQVQDVQTEVKQPEQGGIMNAMSDGNLKESTETGKSDTEKNEAGKSGWTEKISAIVDGIGKIIPKGGTAQPVQVGNYGSPAISDERLKNKEKLAKLFGDDGAIDAFSKIDAYIYNYTPEAQNLYKDGDRGVDDNTHFGPMAQDLAKNPVTSGTVHKDENGYMMVDIRQLALTNTAMISQLARKIEELEERLGGR